MSETASHSSVEMASERSFGIVFFIIFAIVGAWPLIFSNEPPRFWALAVACLFLILGLIAPKVLAPLNKAWFRIGEALGNIIAPIIMAVIFYFVVTPTGIIVRLLGYDLLNQRLDRHAKSYWIERRNDIGSMKDQF